MPNFPPFHRHIYFQTTGATNLYKQCIRDNLHSTTMFTTALFGKIALWGNNALRPLHLGTTTCMTTTLGTRNALNAQSQACSGIARTARGQSTAPDECSTLVAKWRIITQKKPPQ